VDSGRAGEVGTVVKELVFLVVSRLPWGLPHLVGLAPFLMAALMPRAGQQVQKEVGIVGVEQPQPLRDDRDRLAVRRRGGRRGRRRQGRLTRDRRRAHAIGRTQRGGTQEVPHSSRPRPKPNGKHGLPVDPDRIMVRARLRSHLTALKERFPDLLDDCEIQDLAGRPLVIGAWRLLDHGEPQLAQEVVGLAGRLPAAELVGGGGGPGRDRTPARRPPSGRSACPRGAIRSR